jgi:hypothetical protein
MDGIAHPVATLAHIWGCFGTLTYDSRKLRAGLRSWIESGRDLDSSRWWATWWAFNGQLARRSGFPADSHLWACRAERGGHTGRFHLHFLSGSSLLPTVVARLWKWGNAEIRKYEPEGEAVAYMCRCLGVDIEMSRFASNPFADVTLSACGRGLARDIAARDRAQVRARCKTVAWAS